MPTFNRTLWRLAGKLAYRLAARPEPALDLDLQPWRFVSLQRLAERIARITGRPWPVALRTSVQELRLELIRSCRHLGQLADSLDRPLTPPVPTQRLLYDELIALSEEFEDVSFDLRQETIEVVTEPITLEEIELGPFRVVLNGRDFLTGLFQVIAEKPFPAISRSSVTHPHVYDNRLCEGDATVPLQTALWQGRLNDFFQIVQQTLRTYNSDSPYVHLSDWTGTKCRICDDSVSEEESCCCDHCEQEVCGHCSTYCDHCSRTSCDDCLGTCQHCEERSCVRCLSTCPDCRLKYCSNGLINQRCEDCDAARNDETNEDMEEQLDSAQEPAVHTDGVGETALPAGCR